MSAGGGRQTFHTLLPEMGRSTLRSPILLGNRATWAMVYVGRCIGFGFRSTTQG
jgi:hypothetical protein